MSAARERPDAEAAREGRGAVAAREGRGAEAAREGRDPGLPNDKTVRDGERSDLWVLDLWKGYASRDEPVLRGVNLSVPAGSLVAVLGLSGCGKTTLLRAIAGFERAERGRIALGARTLDDGHAYVPPERRGIGYVPQEGALFPNLSVRANIAFGLSRTERRGDVVNELLELVGLTVLARRYPHELSGGEQQRVALARALARGPEVLLLDEPFSSLDASLRVNVREEVSALLRRQGATTVLVTHDQEEALSLADTVAVLRDGVVVQQGTPAELYSQPADAHLAGFLGEANLLHAAFAGDTARTALGAIEMRPDHSRPPGLKEGVVMVRAEQLQVSPRAGAAPMDTHDAAASTAGLPGTVESCRYYGHDALLRIRVEGEHAELPVLLARVHGEQALVEGTAVVVTACGPVSSVG